MQKAPQGRQTGRQEMTPVPDDSPGPPPPPPAPNPPAPRGLRPTIITIGVILLLIGAFAFLSWPYDFRQPLWRSPAHWATGAIALLGLLLAASGAIADARTERRARRHATQRGFEILPPPPPD